MQFKKYFFLFAHPDDEVYCCVLINRLINSSKKVVLVYATSGDAGGNPTAREKEVLASAEKMGVKEKNVHFLQIPEKRLLNRLHQVVNSSSEIVRKFKPDCVLGQDYEGGHEGHDAVSFCAAEVVRLARIKHYFVFPVYHGKPKERKGARFKAQRKKYLTLKLIQEEQGFKKDILEIYNCQKNHFDGLQASSSDYYRLLFSREVYFRIDKRINFQEKPMIEIGYEYHRNGFNYGDFQKAIVVYNNNQLHRVT